MSALEIPELLVAVLSHLNGPALRSCSLVCRMWREPATELLWAQVEDLILLVNQSFSEGTLQHFKPYPLMKLVNQSFSELPTTHPNPNQNQDQDENENEDDAYFLEPSPLDEALKNFKQLPIDWPAETSLFVNRTRRISHLNFANKWSDNPGLLVLHLLQEYQPTALQGMFPRLKALTFGGTRVSPISRTLTAIPSLRHVAFEVTNLGGGIHDWIMACQDAPHLTSFVIKCNNPKDSGSHQNNDLFDMVRFNEPFESPLTTFVSSRPWKHITIPGNMIGLRTLPALGSLVSLETLTINGSFRSHLWGRESIRCVFGSVHTLRLIGTANARLCFTRVVLPNVRHLKLDYNPESKTIEGDCPIAFFTTMVQACPNASSVTYTVRTKAFGEGEFVEEFPETMFEHLLTHGSLERLIVRIPQTCSMRLSDEFLARAARSWPQLQELDIDQRHSSRTKVTLQGLAPFARYCLELRSLQLGIESHHVHTVFNPELYIQEREGGPGDPCGLTYLNVGCPAVYSVTAVSNFFSTLFPKLTHIEHPKSPDSEFYNPGDYFVWSQVVQSVRERDADLDDLARMLRTRDLVEKHGLCDGDPVQSSMDDSDEDYWAYSGSEEENYSSEEDE